VSTTGQNFPQGFTPSNTGSTASVRNLTDSLPTTVMFTAQSAGMFLVRFLVHIVTKGAGAIAVTISGPAWTGPFDVLKGGPNPVTGLDGYGYTVPVWLEAGNQITAETVCSGYTGSYSVFVNVVQAL
jgi:hypothetical protein